MSRRERSCDRAGDNLFDFFGLRTLYDRYLLRHPETRDVIETPQYFFLRIACGIYQCVPDALDFYSGPAAMIEFTSPKHPESHEYPTFEAARENKPG